MWMTGTPGPKPWFTCLTGTCGPKHFSNSKGILSIFLFREIFHIQGILSFFDRDEDDSCVARDTENLETGETTKSLVIEKCCKHD